MAGDHSVLNAWAAAHTGLLVEGQSKLENLVGSDSPDWELDICTGLLVLNGQRLSCALLGSVDDQNNWLWSWADPGLDTHALAVRRALPLREFGEESGLWEFTVPVFPVNAVVDLGMTPGASVALVASPQIMGGAIFSGWEPGRRLYMVLTDPRLSLEQPSAFTVPRYLSGAVAYRVGSPRDIVWTYAGAHQLDVNESGDTMTLNFPDGTHLDVLFGADGRIARMGAAS